MQTTETTKRHQPGLFEATEPAVYHNARQRFAIAAAGAVERLRERFPGFGLVAREEAGGRWRLWGVAGGPVFWHDGAAEGRNVATPGPSFPDALALRDAIDAGDCDAWVRAELARPRTVYVVACSKTKASERRPARELYTSHLFRLSRAVAERDGDAWAILSAEHGIVAPLAELDPYDTQMADATEADRERLRASVEAFVARFAPGTRFVLLMGRSYASLFDATGADTREPLAGMQIGERRSHLAAELDRTPTLF
jgi:hypothetical protein